MMQISTLLNSRHVFAILMAIKAKVIQLLILIGHLCLSCRWLGVDPIMNTCVECPTTCAQMRLIYVLET